MLKKLFCFLPFVLLLSYCSPKYHPQILTIPFSEKNTPAPPDPGIASRCRVGSRWASGFWVPIVKTRSVPTIAIESTGVDGAGFPEPSRSPVRVRSNAIRLSTAPCTTARTTSPGCAERIARRNAMSSPRVDQAGWPRKMIDPTGRGSDGVPEGAAAADVVAIGVGVVARIIASTAKPTATRRFTAFVPSRRVPSTSRGIRTPGRGSARLRCRAEC